jgi:hypothetical protein
LDGSNMDSSNVDSLNMDGSNMDGSNMDGSNVDSLKVETKKKFSYKELCKYIQKICELEYKSAEEISKSLNRDEKYIKNNILPKMLREEKLIKLYPKYHPAQRYISKK